MQATIFVPSTINIVSCRTEAAKDNPADVPSVPAANTAHLLPQASLPTAAPKVALRFLAASQRHAEDNKLTEV